MAKLVRRVTSNDEIVGSNPARGIFFLSLIFNVQWAYRPITLLKCLKKSVCEGII